MKAEERHELQTNSLALFLTRLPELLRQHSTKVLVIILIGLLAIIVYRKRETQALSREQDVREGFAQAINAVESLPHRAVASKDQAALKQNLITSENEINAQLNIVLDESKTATHAGRAAAVWMTRGDMYWNIASVLTGAEAGEYLSRSETAYNKVISDYPKQLQAIRNARLSLAAIAENRANWQAAADQYQRVLDSEGISEVEKAIVSDRITKLNELTHPMLLLPPVAPPTTNPTTTTSTIPDLSAQFGPAALTTGVTTAPTTVPSTAAPTSAPAK